MHFHLLLVQILISKWVIFDIYLELYDMSLVPVMADHCLVGPGFAVGLPWIKKAISVQVGLF